MTKSSEPICLTCSEGIRAGEPRTRVKMRYGKPRYQHASWTDCRDALAQERVASTLVVPLDEFDPVEYLGP